MLVDLWREEGGFFFRSTCPLAVAREKATRRVKSSQREGGLSQP